MNALLQPVPRAITRPVYDNRRVKYASQWADDNMLALKRYFAERGRSLPTDTDDNRTAFAKAQEFTRFCAVQWDIERFA